MHVVNWPIDKPTPYARNARVIPQAAIDKVAASIKEYGFRQPIVVDADGVIIAGHTRHKAAQKLGMADVPVHVAEGLTPAQIKAYRLMDNRSHQEASWENDMLIAELQELGEEIDLSLTGFDEDELARLLNEGNDGLTDPDATPEAPADPVSVPGDVWILGNHRIMCGSSTEADAVAKLLDGVKPHLMVTDPPYGVEYDADWRGKAKNADGSSLSTGKNRAVGKVSNDDNADWSEAWALFPGDVAYVWHAGNKAHVVAESLIRAGLDIRSQIVWAKSHFVISRGDYHPQHEPCWYAVKRAGKGYYNGDRKQSTLWQIDKPAKSETGHSTQKPVECMKRPIENNSSPGQAVYEPFSGSGTTIIAGEMTGRCVYAMELNPPYVDMAVTRWQNFTGQPAHHAGTGEPFPAAKQADAEPAKKSGKKK